MRSRVIKGQGPNVLIRKSVCQFPQIQKSHDDRYKLFIQRTTRYYPTGVESRVHIGIENDVGSHTALCAVRRKIKYVLVGLADWRANPCRRCAAILLGS